MGDDKQSMEQWEMRTQQTPSGTRFRAMTPSSALCDVYRKLTPIRVAIRSSEGKFSGLDPEPTHLPAILSSMPLT